MLPRKGFFPREGVGFALEAAEQQRWREKLQVPRFYGGEENRGSVENGGICGVGVAGGDEGTCEREFQRLGEMAGIAANVEVEVDNRGKRVEVAAGVDEQRKEGNGRGRFHGEKNGDCAGELAGMEKHAEELNGREKKVRTMDRTRDASLETAFRSRKSSHHFCACSRGRWREKILRGQWNS